MLRKTMIAVIVILLAVCAGCQSHQQNKKAAKERWDKASAQIKLSLAEQQYENGKIEEATRTIKECISADPQIPQAHLLLGKLLLAEDRRESAISQLQLAVELDKELAEGWYWLGLATQGPMQAQQSRQTRQTWFFYNKAMTLDPINVEYILAVAEAYAADEKSDEAIELLEERMKVMPKEVSLRVAAADLMYRVGRSDRAVDLYKQALLMTGDDEGIAESLGYCYVFGGRWSEAAEIFNKLVERCQEQLLSQEDGEMRAQYEQSKRLYLRVAALCSMNSAQYGRAVNWYSKLSVEQRDDPEIWVKMGQASLGAGMKDRALMCGRKALALRPGYADAIALIGCAQYAGGDYAAAAKSFEKIAADKKNMGFSWLMRARCYEQLGQTDKAKWAYEKALEINPRSKLRDFLAKCKDTEGL